MNPSSSQATRTIIASAALALGLAGIGGAAHAADPAAGNIPRFEDGVINVHKHSNPAGELSRADGSAQTLPEGAKPLAGVEFTLYQVQGVDLAGAENLNDNSGWDLVQKLTENDSSSEARVDNEESPTKVMIDQREHSLSKRSTLSTDQQGLASFTKQKPGLYVLVEGADKGNNGIVAKAKPFFVVLPFWNARNKEWLKTLEVYPKNTVSEKPMKTVSIEKPSGGVLTWTVEQRIPLYDASTSLSSFKIVDDLSKAGATEATLTSIEKLEVISGEQTSLLVKDTDFTARLEGARLAIEVKPEAMPKLISGANARLTYTTRGEHGLYSNTVSTFINDPTKEIGTSTKTARLGRVEVEKVDKETKKALAGAEFKVCLQEAKAGADCQGIASFTTDERGKGVLNGLRAPGKYVLVETKAPAGYVLDPALRPFEFSGEEAEAAALTASFEVGNAKRSIPTLPLTGANGRLLMILMGTCGLFAALGLALLASKRVKA